MLKNLTNRELECLKYMAQGLSNNEIMRKMYISRATLGTYINRIYNKFLLSDAGYKKTSVLRVRAVLIYLKYKEKFKNESDI